MMKFEASRLVVHSTHPILFGLSCRLKNGYGFSENYAHGM